MHCGKIISVAISFLKNASLPGLLLPGVVICLSLRLVALAGKASH